MNSLDDIIAAALTLFPDSEVGEDNEGQVVIYTGVYLEPVESEKEGY